MSQAVTVHMYISKLVAWEWSPDTRVFLRESKSFGLITVDVEVLINGAVATFVRLPRANVFSYSNDIISFIHSLSNNNDEMNFQNIWEHVKSVI